MKKKKITDENMPIGKLIRVPDFLPPPDQLVFPDGTIKVTLSLTRESVNFFKKKAKRHHTKYQKMIREVVDRYARQFNGS
ncbi:MAG: CopG family transcriptional regulator [Candidatus Omnitrophota bacterium]|nr:CopG family transcriptional regulator [Candidatus Omnitrophota bacterium]